MKDLLKRMLAKNPNDRSSVDELLSHEFFKEAVFLK
jgi:serine/threonine protein kinase